MPFFLSLSHIFLKTCLILLWWELNVSMFDQLSRDIVVFFRVLFMEKRTKVDSVSVGNILKLRERFELRDGILGWACKRFCLQEYKIQRVWFLSHRPTSHLVIIIWRKAFLNSSIISFYVHWQLKPLSKLFHGKWYVCVCCLINSIPMCSRPMLCMHAFLFLISPQTKRMVSSGDDGFWVGPYCISVHVHVSIHYIRLFRLVFNVKEMWAKGYTLEGVRTGRKLKKKGRWLTEWMTVFIVD